MSAYVISDVELLEPNAVARYRALAQDSIAKYGGRYLARGGAIDAVEGDWLPKAIIIVEFPSMKRAREWYRSAEYAEALVLRDRALRRKLIFVDGVPSSRPDG